MTTHEPWLLKLAKTLLFIQQFVQTDKNENIKALRLAKCSLFATKIMSQELHTRFALLLCFVVVRYSLGWLYPYPHSDVTMGAIASQITSLTIVYWNIYSDVDQRKHQSSASLAFVRVIHRWPVNSPHKWPVTREMFPFDDVIMFSVVILPALGQSYGWQW